VKFDATIVGAGPSGLAAAICCAEVGLKVCVLERAVFPRECVGESVHPGAEALFGRLGVAAAVEDAGFERYPGIRVVRGEKESLQSFGGSRRKPWKGFHLWRPDFDQILMNRAKALGVVCLEQCGRSEVDIGNRKASVRTRLGAIDSQLVVDATGRNRWIARQLGLKIRTCSGPLVARYGYRRGRSRMCRETPFFVQRSDGWDWIAQVRVDLFQWILLRHGQCRSGPQSLPDWLMELGEEQPSRGADVTWRFVPECAGRRYFLVGDACSVIDPSASHGIIKALSSGILAANCIHKILQGEFADQDKIASGYIAWQWKWFQRDALRLRELRGIDDVDDMGRNAAGRTSRIDANVGLFFTSAL
jgi:flavin-dependent dehydrogenase